MFRHYYDFITLIRLAADAPPYRQPLFSLTPLHSLLMLLDKMLILRRRLLPLRLP